MKSTHPTSERCGREERGSNESHRNNGFCAQGIAQNSPGISPLHFQWSGLPANLDPAPLQAASRALLSHAPALAPLSCPTTLSPVLRLRSCTRAGDEFLQRQKKSELRYRFHHPGKMARGFGPVQGYSLASSLET